VITILLVILPKYFGFGKAFRIQSTNQKLINSYHIWNWLLWLCTLFQWQRLTT